MIHYLLEFFLGTKFNKFHVFFNNTSMSGRPIIYIPCCAKFFRLIIIKYTDCTFQYIAPMGTVTAVIV